MSRASTQLSEKARTALPAHVAIIMDGNGRWARERGLPRVEGHRRGAESVRAVLRCASSLGIRHLTLYAFSIENWNRPKAEVDTLMKFLARYLKTEQAEMDQNNVRLRAIGQLGRLPGFVREQLDATIASLDANTGEMRVSNFLLWQISYAELVVTDRLWPDFGEADFCAALEAYASRERRFGKV